MDGENMGGALGAVSDAATARRRQEAVHLGHPAERFGESAAAVVVAEVPNDLVEVFSFNRSGAALLPVEGRSRYRFQQPENFLHGLARALFEQRPIGLIQRCMD